MADPDKSLQDALYARKEVLRHCKAVKLTPRKALRRIADALDAKENKVFYDKDRGRCVIGPPMIDWAARAKAVDQAIAILDMKPAEKHDVAVHGEIRALLEEIDGQTVGPPAQRVKK